MIEVKPVTTETEMEGRFLDAFEINRSHILNGRGQSLAKVRDRAIRDFSELGFPGPKDEAWKYTPITRVLNNDYQLAVEPELPAADSLDVESHRIDGLDADVVVLVNGIFVPELSSLSPGRLKVVPLLDAADDPVLLRHFAQRSEPAGDAFVHLNTAFARHGLYVHATSGSAEKLHIINLTTSSGAFLNPRHLFVVEDEGNLAVIETHAGVAGATHFTNSVIESFVGERAKFDYSRIQRDPGMSGVSNCFVYQRESSNSSCTTVTLSGGTLRNNINVLPDAPFCESHLLGLFLASDSMHVDSHTLVDHAKPDCFSNELYKGILSDRAIGVFNGKVLVRPDAQRTNAYQSNKSIVLDDSASMNAKPELEIYADDVKCSHGATTGRLDSEALFYLRSRGLSEQRARTVLLLAFARDVLENVGNQPLRDTLDEMVASQLS
ncbi:MAG: Fe-S cluster assembly protein SufD [Rhodothermia bacterium]|nr:Fe-S cluster assembly protein SufD [Rhodothermia bacterium]